MPQPLYDKYKREEVILEERLDDPVMYIKEMLEEEGIVMEETTISLILKYFNDFKYNMMISGDGIREPGLYSLDYQFRYRWNSGSTKDHGTQPCIVLRAHMDEELRKALGSRFVNSKEVRDKVTKGRELTESEIDYIRRHYAKGS